MSRKSLLLSEELAESAKLELKKPGGNVLVAKKLEAIIAACSFAITEVAKIFNIRHMIPDPMSGIQMTSLICRLCKACFG
ncbi:MAG: hypothetical protein LBT90_02730 [Holosporaceae bacterium]|jgi:hypothetical protein|nr:hypothetical protein [Holosporaceae bacterium]